MKRVLLVGCVLLIGAAPSRPPGAGARGGAPPPDFSKHWHDGKAELDGYRFTVTRYGEPRRGQAVMIYVTEPFSRSKRVKVEDASRSPADVVDVLKLNLVRDFQTGIYDYNTMVSLFVRSSDFAPVKLTFSSAEWCGHVFDETLFGADRITNRVSSYFEDESAERALETRRGGVVEDNLFILLRGLRGPFLAPGESRAFPFLPSPYHARLAHRRSTWTRAEIHREERPVEITVPAGRFATDVYEIAVADGRKARFHVERAYPHRILKWTWKGAPGKNVASWLGGEESGELAGSARLEYWKLNDNGDESYLARLGLAPTPP